MDKDEAARLFHEMRETHADTLYHDGSWVTLADVRQALHGDAPREDEVTL